MEKEGEILDIFRYLVKGVFLVIGFFPINVTGHVRGDWLHWQPPLHHHLYTKNCSKVIPPPHALSRYL